mgnify:CR=1 FL=1
MKRILAVLVVAVTGVLTAPPHVAAQCNEACVEVRTVQGYRGYGCVQANDTGEACIARSTTCFTKLCYNTMITGPSGGVLAMADICGDEVTLRPITREQAPARVATQAATSKSAAASAAKARAG